MRAAASSIASAMPSRRRQISAIAARVVLVHREVRQHEARVIDEEPDRLGALHFGQVGRGGQRQRAHGDTCSPAMPSASRLVATILSALQPARSVSTDSAAASMTCSQLSSTTSVRRASQMIGQAFERRDRPHPGCRAWTPPSRRPVARPERREVDEPHAVGKRAERAVRKLAGEARLAASADAGEREQPRLA